MSLLGVSPLRLPVPPSFRRVSVHPNFPTLTSFVSRVGSQKEDSQSSVPDDVSRYSSPPRPPPVTSRLRRPDLVTVHSSPLTDSFQVVHSPPLRLKRSSFSPFFPVHLFTCGLGPGLPPHDLEDSKTELVSVSRVRWSTSESDPLP